MATWIDGWFDPSSSDFSFLICVHGWFFFPCWFFESIMERQCYPVKGGGGGWRPFKAQKREETTRIYTMRKKMFTCYPVPNEKRWKFKRNFSFLFFAIHRRVSFSSFFPWKSERMLGDKETKHKTKCHCIVVAIHGKTLVSVLMPDS